jgi:hypothetical protein
MSSFIASGRAVDVVLGVLAVETVWLLSRGRRPWELVGRLMPGAFLLLALRCALAGSDPLWIGLFLTASFPVHLLDLAQRSAQPVLPAGAAAGAAPGAGAAPPGAGAA